MKRALVPHIPEMGSLVEPDREEAHHLLKVRRVTQGEQLEIIDGCGHLALAEVVIQERKVLFRILETPQIDRESPLRLELGLGLPVSLQTIDHNLPSLVQLGVKVIRMGPVAYGGRIKKEWPRYKARLDQICLQALKQSGRLMPPQLIYHETFEELCRAMSVSCQDNLIFHPTGEPVVPLHQGEVSALGLVVGPEGGFTEEEVEIAMSFDMRPQQLGPRILKMETVMVGACFWAQSTHGDAHNP